MLNLHEVNELSVQSQEDVIGRLALHARTRRTCAKAIVPLGLQQHPGIQQLKLQSSGDRELNRAHRAKVVEIIFHMDGPTLMKSLPDVSAPSDDQPPAPPAPRRALDSGHGRLYNMLWSKYAGPFLKDTFIKDNPDMNLSIGQQ